MAKIKTLRVHKTDPKTKTVLIDFTININANAQGKFYAKLPEDIVKRLKETNTLPKHFERDGSYYAQTLNELEKEILQAIDPLVNYKQVSNIIVIKYRIKSACNYAISKCGQFYPHHAQQDKTIEFENDINGNLPLQHGTEIRDNGTHQGPYGINIGITFRRKITNQYGDGSQKTYYDYVSSHDLEENGKWLKELIGMTPLENAWSWENTDKLPEIEYTERNALFFRQFLTGIFKINELIKHLNNENMLQEMINKNKSLMPFE